MSARILPVADSAQVRRFVKDLAVRHTRALSRILGLFGLATLAGLVGPRLLGDIVQGVQTGTTLGRLNLLVVLIGGFILLQTLLTHWAFRAAGRFSSVVLAELREEFVDQVLDLPLSTVENAGAGDLVTRASRDVDALRRSAQLAAPQSIVAVVTVLLAAGASVITSPLLSVVLLISVPPLFVITRWYLRRARNGYLREGAAFARITDGLVATVLGAATIDAFGMQRRRIENADENIAESYAAMRYTMRLRTVLYPIEGFFFVAPVSAALLLGGYAYTRGWADLAQITAVTLYIQQLMYALETLLDWLGTLQTGGASLARLLGVAQISPDRQVAERAVADPRALIAQDVQFSYVDGRDVLHGIDLTVHPGERIAIVGPSGAGKSTVGRLLAGIHGPRTGSVTLGGAPLTGLPLDDLRREVVLVTQDHHVFAGTLRENLCLAVSEAIGDEALWQSLDAVDAHGWASALPDGLDTLVGSGGEALSAPQSQQLALARLLLADPRALVLDEATSLLDPRAARHLERSLSAVLKGRTVIAIAHRLHTAHDADRVAVIDGGLVTELGSHDELIEADGAYASLWRSWN